MMVNFQTLGVWDVVCHGVGKERDDVDDHDDR
jgi:hypothetical protein